jgi:hypothetical protein
MKHRIGLNQDNLVTVITVKHVSIWYTSSYEVGLARNDATRNFQRSNFVRRNAWVAAS